jgi:hypothetical protein
MKSKYDDIIILYLDNRMSGKEKQDFEKELERSPELFERYSKIRMNMDSLKSTEPESDEGYFRNLTSGFRQKLEQKEKTEKRFIPVFISGAGIAAVALLLFIFVFNQDNGDNSADNMAELDYSDMESVLSYYPYYSTDPYAGVSAPDVAERLDSLITRDYLLSDAASFYFEYNSALNAISEEDADYIYSYLINKDIIIGEL